MPLDIRCEHCHGTFRLADKAVEKFSGKKVKCPTCKQSILIPAQPSGGSKSSGEVAQSGQTAAVEPKPEPPAPAFEKSSAAGGAGAPAKAAKKATADKWYLQTEEGEQYGPVSKAELDQWLAEGRIDASCQILCEGWDQWRWAEDVYPALAQAAAQQPIIDTSGGKTSGAAEGPVIGPVESPQAAPVAILAEEREGVVTVSRSIRRSMQETRPWVMLMAILGLISNGILLLVGLLAVLSMAIAAVVLGLAVAPVWLTSPILGLIGSYLLLSYGMRIGDFCRRDGVRELEAAIDAQKSFWKFTGIVVLVVLGLALVTVVLVLAIGGLAALGVAGAARATAR